ncbi:MAG TPA: DUF3788 family protein [Prolixibacteraceae bacterium]|nr:DUF3788 family protein [Prolixibacteraceae bacterium]
MEEILLRDPLVEPDETVLRKTLQESYPVFEKLSEEFCQPDFSLELLWRYYNDGKAWLCKVVHKKKTICWISAWDGYFKTGFYFTEKAQTAIDALEIDPDLKETFHSAKAIGKLIPLIIGVREMKQLADVFALARLKKELK